jgi:hypothetical protein
MHGDKPSFSAAKLPQRVKVGNDSDNLRNSLGGETHAIVQSFAVPCMPLWATVCNKCMLHHTNIDGRAINLFVRGPMER